MNSYGQQLLEKGWVVVKLSEFSTHEEETQAFSRWEDTFKRAFDLPHEVKQKCGEYRVEHGVSVGYRHDEEREFLESRLTSDGIAEPNLGDYINDYHSTVRLLYVALNRVATRILNEVSDLLGWDRLFLLGLTDIVQNGILPLVPKSISKSKPIDNAAENTVFTSLGAPEMRVQYSSSLLRICKYIHEIDRSKLKKVVSFGAHTDSSFITVAPVSSTPGLEVVDQQTNSWICPELHAGESQGDVLIFAGEFLQVLTKNRFKATVHRVVEFPAASSLNDVDCPSSQCRISCPYLVRGLNEAVINMHDERFNHHPDALTPDKVPDLDGTTMKLLHKLLDLKRQKCFRDNDSKPGSWVLSAFPVDNVPMEED